VETGKVHVDTPLRRGIVTEWPTRHRVQVLERRHPT
jgi:hypothetical protein